MKSQNIIKGQFYSNVGGNYIVSKELLSAGRSLLYQVPYFLYYISTKRYFPSIDIHFFLLEYILYIIFDG